MRIFSNISNKIQNTNYTNNANLQKTSSNNVAVSLPVKNYSAENIKANFLPSFGAFRKAGSTAVLDKVSGQYVPAEIRKEKLGDYTTFIINVDRQKAGYLEMKANSVVPEKDFILTTSTNYFPKITHLRTIMGERYSGIGTALIKAAIQESYNTGNEGNLWLYAEKGYQRTLSPYRADENPIPFYYKLGFESPNPQKDAEIRENIEKGRIDRLPKIELLVLNEERRDEWLKKLAQSPVLKQKESLFF